jgi:hypothetical protein
MDDDLQRQIEALNRQLSNLEELRAISAETYQSACTPILAKIEQLRQVQTPWRRY